MLTVIKRDGRTTDFDDSKIKAAMASAFNAVYGAGNTDHQLIQSLSDQVCEGFMGESSVSVESIQDRVEGALMLSGHQGVARAYVIYRERQALARTQAQKGVTMTLSNGHEKLVTQDVLISMIGDACDGLVSVDPLRIAKEVSRTLYEGVAEREVSEALRIATRVMIEQEPEYSFVAARLLAADLKRESREYLLVTDGASYGDDLVAALNAGIKIQQISPLLLDGRFVIADLCQALVKERDAQFTYLGLQTLYDRYFLHDNDRRYERPQVFFMRVAMGLSLNESDPTKTAIEFYNLLSEFRYMASTPTLFNSGTLRPQLSSCYLTTVPDDLSGIYHSIHDNAMLSKFAGGLGNDWTPVRAMGSYIKGTNGESQGVIPFLKVVNDTALAVNQGGKRKGAVCAYLETWHIDIEDFLDLRKNTGDDRRRTHDMNTANWIPDLFMRRVFHDQDWTLFCPSEAPDLHDLTGKAFEERYCAYEQMGREGKLRQARTLPAKDLWRKMLTMLFETGHPWLTFKDACNLRSPQQHVGVVHSSNLCTEITLNTSADEIAVCNLGSVNLPKHIVNGALDMKMLKDTVTLAMRMLDNVIDINYYAVEAAKHSNLRHRPVGLGLMGFQDALYALKLPFASDAAVQFADESMEAISYFAIEASHHLSVERGAYSTFEGSLWSQGILPIDSIEILAEQRGNDYLDMDRSSTLDWGSLRTKVKTGMRNSNVMAIAPTATISNIIGVSQSIEPTYENLYVKSNLSGEFTYINPSLVNDLKALGIWDQQMIEDLKFQDGSVQDIDRIPQHLKTLYATAFQIEPRWMIDAASRRQKWIDQAISLNLYMAQASGKKLDTTYRMAWYRGLKTTYYLRAQSATKTEKSTVSKSRHNAVASN